MLWGDIGTGKTTFGIQLSQYILAKKLKVFYIFTKQMFPTNLIKRILNQIDPNLQENLIFWNPDTFSKQMTIISSLNLRIQEIFQCYNQNRVGLIVIDEITSLYLMELGSEKKNEILNQKLTFQLATLAEIQKKYHVPILILNSFSNKKDEKDQQLDVPYGGKIIEYWTEIDLKIERTSHFSRRIFECIKNIAVKPIPTKWLWTLVEHGFD